jgi:hypothetical protein
MRVFPTLSYSDKLRVSRYLVRGEAPAIPRMAAAAVELAESYHDKGRTYLMVMRWVPLITVVGLCYLSVSAVLDGDHAMFAVLALVVLGSAWSIMFNPVFRPKNIDRCLKASRRVIASADG